MKKSMLVIAAAIGLVVIASVAIWKTSGDDSRRQGALVDQPVTLSWHGDWSAETEYTAGSVVTFEGESYVAEGEKHSTPIANCGTCGWVPLADASSPEAESTGERNETIESGYHLVLNDFRVDNNRGAEHSVQCPSGKIAVGGGIGEPRLIGVATDREDLVVQSHPQAWVRSVKPVAGESNSGWVFQFNEYPDLTGGSYVIVPTFVACISVP